MKRVAEGEGLCMSPVCFERRYRAWCRVVMGVTGVENWCSGSRLLLGLKLDTHAGL